MKQKYLITCYFYRFQANESLKYNIGVFYRVTKGEIENYKIPIFIE